MPDQYQLSQDDLNRFSAESHQQASPETSSLQELRPLPWWKRYLMGELEEKSQSAPVSGGSSSSGYDPVKTYENLGKGAGKGLRVLLGGGMADGGAVQGPTQVLIGEGGEPEYVLPQSKVAPWIAATLRSGAPPNPANVPRAEPPPPVILPPQMCNGGKVMPHMKDGGKVLPILLGIGGGVLANSGMFGGLGGQLSSLGMDMLRQQLLPSDDKGLPAMANGGMVLPPYQDPSALNPDDPRYGQFEPEAPFASGPGFEMPPTPASAQQSVPRPALPRVAPPELAARQKYQDLIAKGPPQGAWYDRLFASREGGGGPMDMRPGVAPYSIAGRAAGRVIGSLLPINKKREAYGRDVAAAKVGMDTEAAQIAAAQRADAENRARVVAESQMSADEARRLSEEARLRKLNTPPPPVDPYKDMVEVTPEIGAKAGVAAGPDGKFRLPKSAVRVPSNTPRALTIKEVTDAQGNVRRDFYNPDGTLNRTENLPKAGKPQRSGGGGPRRETNPEAVARVTQRVIEESMQGGGTTVADAIRNVGKFYQGDEEVKRYRPEIVKRLQAEAKARGEELAASSSDLDEIAKGLNFKLPGTNGAKPKTAPNKPPQAAQAAPAPQTLSVGGKSYKVGDSITLKNGKTVTIRKINPDGTFED